LASFEIAQKISIDFANEDVTAAKNLGFKVI